MSKLMTVAKNFINDENGATMVEYGLMLALIAIVCIGAVITVGTSACTIFTDITTHLSST